MAWARVRWMEIEFPLEFLLYVRVSNDPFEELR
ncbi:protein of unknown function [Bradyrhizobium vignae]|uniref:Uncharacterized protein n=1 Tax=Bradyrhizobium vignae TaxID=1549949 RepID=A0A2U3PZ07_9BRAD|nr:protein of unknown function [Bradyrhizobium vignae]